MVFSSSNSFPDGALLLAGTLSPFLGEGEDVPSFRCASFITVNLFELLLDALVGPTPARSRTCPILRLVSVLPPGVADVLEKIGGGYFFLRFFGVVALAPLSQLPLPISLRKFSVRATSPSPNLFIRELPFPCSFFRSPPSFF